MKIIRPITVTDANMVYSDVSETTPAAWNSGTTYAVDATATYKHRIWKSLANSNLNKQPDLSPTFWVDTGPTNRWAVFDDSVSSLTTKNGSFTYRIQAGATERIDSVALLNLTGTSVRIKVTVSPEGVVYDETYNLVSTVGISDWYAYFYTAITRSGTLTLFDLPTYLAPLIEITVSNGTLDAKCGVIILGEALTIGRTQYGATVGIVDFSRKERDQFGNWKVVERAYSDRGNFTVMVDNSKVDQVKKVLSGYRAKAMLYVGTDEFESTTVYGFYKDFSVAIQYYTESALTIEIEGLT